MTVSKYLPLAFSDYWLGSTAIDSNVMLLRDDVTSIPETVTSSLDLETYEISSGTGYVAGGYGAGGPELTRVQDDTSGAVEYHCGSQLWQTDNSLTVSGFQWIVLLSQTTPLAVWDLGSTTSLSGSKLTLQFSESPYISGIYPVLRFLRNTA